MRIAQAYGPLVQQNLEVPLPTESSCESVWFGTVAWRTEDGWATPLRLGTNTGVSDKLARTAECAVGVRAELETDASTITLPIRASEDGQVVDLVIDGELVKRVQLDDSDQIEFALPGRTARVEIWLPQTGICQVGRLRLGGASTQTAQTAPQHRPRWAAYGSSITQCSAADGPSSTWPALVARRLGWDLSCFGFNGLAHLDLPVAEVMATVRPAVVTVCAGINIFNQASFTRPELATRLTDFVDIIRRDHAEVAVGVISPITSPEREQQLNSHQLTLGDVRTTVEETAGGRDGVSAIPGPAIFGAADVELLSDGLHPTAAGYRLMADRLTPWLASLLP